MKLRISATIEEETNKFLDEIMREGGYRNKSHVIESAIKFLRKKTIESKK